MNRDDIIRMAQEAYLHIMPGWLHNESVARNIESFAALVAAAEREECAKVAEDGGGVYDSAWDPYYNNLIAKAIRSRGSDRSSD